MTRISYCFVSLAGAFLLSGLIFYLTFRSSLPAPLQLLHVQPFRVAHTIKPNIFTGSFPSFVHVAAFALMTCAFLRASIFSAVAAAALWAAIDIFWEIACNNPLVLAGYKLLGVTRIPACTFDYWDIVASLLGAVAAVAIAGLVLKVYSHQSYPAKGSHP